MTRSVFHRRESSTICSTNWPINRGRMTITWRTTRPLAFAQLLSIYTRGEQRDHLPDVGTNNRQVHRRRAGGGEGWSLRPRANIVSCRKSPRRPQPPPPSPAAAASRPTDRPTPGSSLRGPDGDLLATPLKQFGRRRVQFSSEKQPKWHRHQNHTPLDALSAGCRRCRAAQFNVAMYCRRRWRCNAACEIDRLTGGIQPLICVTRSRRLIV
jgi:hypothetical protein